MDDQFDEIKDIDSDSIEAVNIVENLQKVKNKTTKKNLNSKFKDDYFDFYDDVKNHTKSGREDW